MAAPRDPVIRFQEKVSPEPNSGCWLWTGAVDMFGHGHLSVNNYPVRAHRFAFETYVGAIPDGALVTHTCDVASCVNPDHLRLGTHQTNMTEMASRGRGIRSKRNLPRGVHFHNDCRGGRYTVSFRRCGVRIHLGSYRTVNDAEKASRAFLSAEPAERGEFKFEELTPAQAQQRYLRSLKERGEGGVG